MDEMASAECAWGDVDRSSVPAIVNDGEVLEELKQQRADAAALSRIADRLSTLQKLPDVASEAEQPSLYELLASVRQQALKTVEERPATARPFTGNMSILHPLPPLDVPLDSSADLS